MYIYIYVASLSNVYQQTKVKLFFLKKKTVFE